MTAFRIEEDENIGIEGTRFKIIGPDGETWAYGFNCTMVGLRAKELQRAYELGRRQERQ